MAIATIVTHKTQMYTTVLVTRLACTEIEVKDQPILGFGFDVFYYYYASAPVNLFTLYAIHQHSMLLQRLFAFIRIYNCIVNQSSLSRLLMVN